MPKVENFTFNGLTGADLVIFNLLSDPENQLLVSGYDISRITCYSPSTVYRSLKRLQLYGVIKSTRTKSKGRKYQHVIRS